MLLLWATLFIILCFAFLISGVITAISLILLLIKWGLILTGVYLLAKAIVEFLS